MAAAASTATLRLQPYSTARSSSYALQTPFEVCSAQLVPSAWMLPLHGIILVAWSLCLTTKGQRSRPLPATPEHWQWHMGSC